MTPFDIAMNQQRLKIEALNAMIQSLNSETFRLKHNIITAASYAIKNNPEAAIELIIRASERINNEATNQLANHHAGTIGQNGCGH